MDGGGVDFDYEQKFTIDGRSNREEEQWWNPEEREKHQRPGPGILAPLLAEKLHDSNHSLFSVNLITRPTTSQMDLVTCDSPPPSENELRASIPHPDAYYCPKDNGWVILSWKSSSILPLAQSYIDGFNPSLPDPMRRRRTSSCIEEAGQPFGKANRTHHFHIYEGAVDGQMLMPPLGNDERAVLDLYVCCQCTVYCVASKVISGVVSKRYMDELQREKNAHPAIGRTPQQAVALTIETLITAVENRLFKENHRHILVNSPGFQQKVGWNSNIKRIFESFGFEEDVATTLKPPSLDPSTRQGKQNRRNILRAWVELASWLSDFKRINAQHFGEWKEYRSHVRLDSAQEMYQMAIGAHPDQIPRGELSDAIATMDLDLTWKMLGLTSLTYSPELLGFAYLAQCRCDPSNTPAYFTYLANIAKALHEEGSCPPLLQELVTTEQLRDRFTVKDVLVAATVFGFGLYNSLQVEYDEDVPDDFVEQAWKNCLNRAWRDHETRRLANESFRILAEDRRSVRLRAVWENAKNRSMNPHQAYDTLEVPPEIEDDTLISVYNMRLYETLNQLDERREAMLCIAEVRDSDQLRQFTSGMEQCPRFALYHNHSLPLQKPTGLIPATLSEGPKMGIDTFCAVYSLSNNILQQFHENAITGTHAFSHITETDLTTMGFKTGEVVDLKEAIKVWASF